MMAAVSLIVRDHMTPVMNGFEFLQRIRQSDAWRENPVVVLTAKDLTPEERNTLPASVLAKSDDEGGELVGEVRAAIAARIGDNG
jgi:CheY-like chemotaxis protein